MYLFDLQDYYGSKIIGNHYEKIPICDSRWCDMAATAGATRDAYLSALSQWYDANSVCLEDGPCKDAILAKWAVILSDVTTFNSTFTAFWSMMCGDDCTGEYNPTLYQNNINAQNTLLCDIEELTYLVNGEPGVPTTTTTTTTTIAPTTTTTTTTTLPPPNPSIDCTTSSLSGSGSRGLYYIPMVVPANVCNVQLTFDVATVPDSLSVMSADKSTYYAQTGYFGQLSLQPDPGFSYNYGPGQFDGEIYKYDPLGVGNFVVDTLASPETLEIIDEEYPITNTDPTKIPISYNPASPNDTIRTITWNKGATANDVNILIRIVGSPTYSSTVWNVTAITCVNCPSPTTTTTTVNPCPNCVSGDITIGTQVWAKCNLDVTTYRDGTPIPEVTDPTAWAALTTGAWCWYNNDSANGPTYGKLYNWYAVTDARGFGPFGYHVPTDTELTTLTDYLGGLTVAGGKMKETGLCHWNIPNIGATNTSLFTGLPGGVRNFIGGFSDVGEYGGWWSSSEYDTNTAWSRDLDKDSGSAFSNVTNKWVGLSVRLIKD